MNTFSQKLYNSIEFKTVFQLKLMCKELGIKGYFCYGLYKFKMEKNQMNKQIYETNERLKELDLNLFRVETYTKQLLKQQQNNWLRKNMKKN